MIKKRDFKLFYLSFVLSLPVTLLFTMVFLFRIGIFPEYPLTVIVPVLMTGILFYFGVIILKNKLIVILLSLYIFYFSFVLIALESYFPPAPYIGTTFSKNFNWSKYEMIKTGMTKNEVDNLIGEPFMEGYSRTGLNGKCYSYSKDGSLLPIDLAWVYAGVCFDRNNQVIETHKDIIYN